MPNPKVCNKITDPAARQRCLDYQGEFAQNANQGGAAQGTAPGRMRPPQRRGGGGFGGGRRRPGGGGFGGGY